MADALLLLLLVVEFVVVVVDNVVVCAAGCALSVERLSAADLELVKAFAFATLLVALLLDCSLLAIVVVTDEVFDFVD
jgi:hypothetical protein